MNIAPTSSATSDMPFAVTNVVAIVGVGSLPKTGSLILDRSVTVGSTTGRSCPLVVRESSTAALASLSSAITSVVNLDT